MQEFKRIDITRDEIIPTAERMRTEGRQLIMIHGYLDNDGKPVVSYDYEVNGCTESYNVTGEMKLPSISEIYSAAAEWPERELNELIGLEFEGLDVSKRLFLPEDFLDGKGHILVTPLSELVDKAFGKKEEA